MADDKTTKTPEQPVTDSGLSLIHILRTSKQLAELNNALFLGGKQNRGRYGQTVEVVLQAGQVCPCLLYTSRCV